MKMPPSTTRKTTTAIGSSLFLEKGIDITAEQAVVGEIRPRLLLQLVSGLLEEGFHSPTVYFPLIVDEALMIEPTETESPQTLAALADALERVAPGAPRG